MSLVKKNGFTVTKVVAGGRASTAPAAGLPPEPRRLYFTSVKPTPFDPDSDYEPVPFDEKTLVEAASLRDAGLEFRPHVGCFVWDRDHAMPVDSPFPNRVYFILNLGRFEAILGSRAAIAERLIWLPTETQARQLLRDHGGDAEAKASGIRDLYTALLRHLA
jgi:hypothetical protein